jgi:hypothetical protein
VAVVRSVGGVTAAAAVVVAGVAAGVAAGGTTGVPRSSPCSMLA